MDTEGNHSAWALAAIRVIGLCGGRVSEVLQLSRGKDTRLDQGFAMVREHKGAKRTGAKRLELPPAAVHILQGLPEESENPWFFPGRVKGSHLTRHGLHKLWMIVRERAGVPDMHLHDFRSFTASESLDMGISTKVAAAILGHDPRTTERHYQRARDKRVAEAAAQISAPVAQAFGLEPTPQPNTRKLLRRGFERVKSKS
jgi:integrase